jgi:threonine 3-dehydrogenase
VRHRSAHLGLERLGSGDDQPPDDWNDIIFKAITIQGIYGREMFETWYKMAAMLQSGLNVRPLLTHHLPAADFKQAFDVMRSGRAGKIVLDWT